MCTVRVCIVKSIHSGGCHGWQYCLAPNRANDFCSKCKKTTKQSNIFLFNQFYRSSTEESIRTYSPHPLRPKSPQSPTGSASPRPASTGNQHRRSHDENTAPKSPKGASRSPRATESPTPGSGGVRVGRLDTGAPKEGVIRRPDQSPGRRTEGSDFSMKKRLDIKTYYMYHQSELIKPVSVKLENCMLTTDKGKSYLDGSGLSCGSSSSATGSLPPSINLPAHRGPWTHLTQWELKGLRVLVKWLEEMPPNKRVLPKDLQDYEPLLRDVKVCSWW